MRSRRTDSSQAVRPPIVRGAGRRSGRCARLAVVFAALVVLVGIGAAPAGASTGRFHFGFFGPDGTESTNYAPNGIWSLDFNQASNDLLAISPNGQHPALGDCIDRFHTTEAGLPVRPNGFPAAGGSSICGFSNLEDIAVDNSATPSQGRIYVTGLTGGVRAFDSNGAELGGNFPLTPPGLPRSIVVDSLGNLWVGTDSAIREYDSSGNLLGEPVKISPGGLAFDSEDNLYAQIGGKVLRYAKAGGYAGSEEIDPGNSLGASVIAIDRGDDHLLAYRAKGETQEVDEYDLTLPGYPEVEGSPVAERPAITVVQGMAVDEEAGVFYLSDLGPPDFVHAYSRYGTHPEVATGGTDNVTNSAATLIGSVDPESTETQCHFEYGPTDAYGTSVPCILSPGSGKGSVEVHADIGSLKASSVYHYRLVAENPVGAVPGEDELLTTFGPPAISDAGFDSATTTTADVSAKINPANQASTYRVEYLPEAAYEANTPIDEQQQLSIDAGSGTFTLSYDGPKTAPLDFDSSAAEIEAALQGLASIGDVGGTVALSGSNPYSISFGGGLGGEDLPQIEVDDSDLEGGTGAEVQTTTEGHSRFAGAQAIPVPDKALPVGTADVAVPITITGLSPDSAYRFRYLANNVSGTRRGEVLRLQTYAPVPTQAGCPNEALRKDSPSALLPDCRAYEVVSGELHGGVPAEEFLGAGGGAFSTELASPDGQSLIFATENGALPGTDGNGTTNRYEALRGASGWSKRLVSPSGEQATITFGGGLSPDHEYSTWKVESCCGGNLSNPLHNMHYLRRPDGSFELLGKGEPGFEDDDRAQAMWIAPHGAHIVIGPGENGALPLAPEASRSAIYDRTPAGLQVVSILPEEQPLGPSESPEYQGTSADGSVVAFKVKGKAPLYLRIDNNETIQVVGAANIFAGLSANGDRLLYLKNGDVFSYDVAEELATQVSTKAEATVVNVSADGSHVFFASQKVLDEAEEGELGKDNLYVWDEASGQIRLIGVLDPEDLSEENGVVSLAKWVSGTLSADSNPNSGPGNNPSQSTPDGSAFIFRSYAQLSAYDNQGHSEIYRYQESTESLACLSCSPIGTRARSDAQLQTRIGAISARALIHNISDDGRRAFFEAGDALVEEDTDGFDDVYEWEAQGKGSCKDAAGCVYLITGGQSLAGREGVFAGDYLYAATPNGENVFVRSDDLLVPESELGGEAAIYDVKVGGGFTYPSPSIPCQGDGCKGPQTKEPAAPGAGSAVFSAPPEPSRPSSCPKGKRKVRKAGKTRCVKPKHRKYHRNHRNRKGAVR